ncbi:aminotransferase class IV [Micromonospora chalcea]
MNSESPLPEGTSELVWLDGEWRPWSEGKIHVRTGAHMAVAGIFEGIRAYWSEERRELFVYRLSEHLLRLRESCRLLLMRTEYSVDDLKEIVTELLRRNNVRQDAYVRPVMFPSLTSSGFLSAIECPTSLFVECWPAPSARGRMKSVSACTSSWRRISNLDMVPRAKTFANYAQARLAAIESGVAGYDLPLLLNNDGYVTEGVGAGVAMVCSGTLVLPPLSAGALPSITRMSLTEIAASRLGLRIDERLFDRFECYLADELFFFGTGWEILAIRRLDGHHIGVDTSSSVVSELSRIYYESAVGEHADLLKWLTPTYA